MTKIRTRIPKETQADQLMIIAKNLGINRNDLMNEIVSGIADDLPDVKYEPNSNIQITITGANPDDIKKINAYCNSINSCFGEELKRGISVFIRNQNQNQNL